MNNMKDEHYLCLENMYLAAPINKIYQPTIEVLESEANIEIQLFENYFHTAGAVHGSVYFKMLDDAAFFAANSMVRDVFVLTTSFTTYITRPVSSGILRAEGRVLNSNKSQIIAEAVAYDENNREVARGNGVFMRSKIELAGIKEYKVD